jgi:hypothetical protein
MRHSRPDRPNDCRGRAARARPDGYTISLGTTGSHALNGALYSLPYDVLNDFVPVSLLVTSPLILFLRRARVGGDRGARRVTVGDAVCVGAPLVAEQADIRDPHQVSRVQHSLPHQSVTGVTNSFGRVACRRPS